MKTFVVYSKKPKNFIFSIKDLSSLQFIKYGFNFMYFFDFFNIYYSIKRKFFVITAMLVAIYLLFWQSTFLQTFSIISIAFLSYAMEGWFLKKRKYHIIGTIEAKNINQAKEFFIKNYITNRQNISIK